MHVFVSDIHMADGPAGDPVSDDELAAFVDGLPAGSRGHDVTLVLLGDIIDFLRSSKWADLWGKNVAPWSAMAKGFANFPRSPAEGCVLEVARDVATRYRAFSKALRARVDGGRLTVVYVPGNHDYMLQLSARLRREVKGMLGLANEDAKPFDIPYDDEPASVYATHGHTFDPLNHHRDTEGCWAFGDAVVLRLVNRFQAEACAALGCGEDTDIGRRLADIDNVEPLVDIPLFVRWVSETLSSADDQAKVLDAWTTCVNELLAIKAFADKRYRAKVFLDFRALLRLSTHAALAELIVAHRRWFPVPEARDVEEAGRLSRSQRRRFVVFGHTHNSMMVPLRPVGGQPAYYVNTGSWRRIVSRGRDPGGGFVGSRVSGRFVVGDADGPSRRYRLVREWHAT